MTSRFVKSARRRANPRHLFACDFAPAWSAEPEKPRFVVLILVSCAAITFRPVGKKYAVHAVPFVSRLLRVAAWNDKDGEMRVLDGSPLR